jgi:hypothetical protein
MGIDNIKELYAMGSNKKDKKDQQDPVNHPDWAPDANEPGDPAPKELEALVHEGEIVPDQVDGPSEVTE